MSATLQVRIKLLAAAAVAIALLLAASCTFEGSRARIPLTTTDDEAREQYLKGRTAFDVGRVRHAHWRFGLALRADPEFAMAYLGVFKTTEDPAAAQRALTRAAALIKRLSAGERQIILSAWAFFNENMVVELKHLRDLVDRYPDDSQAHLLIGDMYSRRDNLAAAEESYTRAERLAPDEPGPKLRLARIHSVRGEFDEAIEKMISFVALDPDESRFQMLFGDFLMKAGRFEQATQSYRDALELDAEESGAWIGLGSTALLSGDFAAAEVAFEELRQLAADEDSDALRTQASHWVAATHMHRGELDRAVEVLVDAAVEAEGESRPFDAVDLRLFAADALLSADRAGDALHQIDAARTQWQQADMDFKARAAAQAVEEYYRIRIVIANGELEQARGMTRAYRRNAAVARAPGSKSRFNELSGRVSMLEGDFRAASSVLSRADKDDPRIVLLRSHALAEQERVDEARELLERIVGWNEALPELGDVLPEARQRLSKL